MTERSGIAVYGATGYTGMLIAGELVAMGHDVVVAGRSAASLDRIAGGGVRQEVVPLDDTDGLIALASRVHTIVNAAGPFAYTCMPVARAAVAGGAHYVDISGEQHAIKKLFDDLGTAAVEAGTALLPSSAFYATLCDLLVSLADQGMDGVDITPRRGPDRGKHHGRTVPGRRTTHSAGNTGPEIVPGRTRRPRSVVPNQ